jgi:glycerol-3-phosphate acyltransferase PlsY
LTESGLTVLAAVFGYLLGSVPYGYIIGRMMGRDLMSAGSKSSGATNALRTLGLVPALVTLVLDVGKTVVAVIVARRLLAGADPVWQSRAAVAAAVAVIIGHSWSLFLRFRGGKSVAASFGGALILMPGLIPYGLGAFVLTIAVTRYVSLGSLLGTLTIVGGSFIIPQPMENRIFTAIAGTIIFWRHRANISRLISGTENKIGQKAR